MNIYDTHTMMQALPSLRKSPRFLQDAFFKNMQISTDKHVIFDVKEAELRLAPFVSPRSPGKAMKASGYQTHQLAPAYVKPHFALDPEQPLRRQMGEDIGGDLTPAAREALMLSQALEDQRDMITRRVEVMCSELLRTSKITVTGEHYPTVVVDFGRAVGQTILLETTDRWGETDVSPVDDVEDWGDTTATACGAAITDIVMDKEAWKLFRADPKFLQALDRDYGQVGIIDLGLTMGEPGSPQYKGSDGTLRYWVYNDTYIDDNGQTQKLLPAYSVIGIAAAAAAGTQGYGAIIDPNVGYTSGKYVPKSWLIDNPGQRMLMTQSAPMPFFGRIEATFFAQVR